MVTSRKVEESDRTILEQALAKDVFHPLAKPEQFYQPDCAAHLYEVSGVPTMFVRATKTIWIDIVFTDNDNRLRNREALIAGFKQLCTGACKQGFTRIFTSTNGPGLLQFAIDELGFEEVNVAGEVALRFML